MIVSHSSTTTQKPEKDCSTLSNNFDLEWIDGRSVNFSCIGISQTAKSYREASNFCANLNQAFKRNRANSCTSGIVVILEDYR